MGGNTKAINRETGDIISFAEKIDLRVISPSEFKNTVIELLLTINQIFKNKFGFFLWENDEILMNGKAVNGSSMYIFNNQVSEEELLKYKPIFGDLDITIPHENLEQLFELLTQYEGVAFTKRITYVGQNKKRQMGNQINALFNLDDKLNFQIDFEGTKFKNNEPSDFAKFAHSSDWEDIKCGYKGVAHKFILINLVRSATSNGNVVILTPASSIYPSDKKFRLKTMHEPPRMCAFSIDKGLREKYKLNIDDSGNPVLFQGKKTYKEQPTNESNYITDISEIFNFIFKKYPTQEELKLFNSFIGITTLMKKYISKSEVVGMFDFLLKNSLFGDVSQQLSRTDWKEDLAIKLGILNHLFKEFSYLNEKVPIVKQMSKEFYRNYNQTK